MKYHIYQPWLESCPGEDPNKSLKCIPNKYMYKRVATIEAPNLGETSYIVHDNHRELGIRPLMPGDIVTGDNFEKNCYIIRDQEWVAVPREQFIYYINWDWIENLMKQGGALAEIIRAKQEQEEWGEPEEGGTP